LAGRIPGHRPLAYKTSTYSRQLFVEEMSWSLEFERAVDKFCHRAAVAGAHVASEVFARIYDTSAKPVPEPHPAASWAVALHSSLDGLQDFKAFQRRYRFNAEGAALATQMILEAIVEKMPPQPENDEPESVEYNPDDVTQAGDEPSDGLDPDGPPQHGGWSSNPDDRVFKPKGFDNMTDEEAAAYVARNEQVARDMAEKLKDFIDSRGMQKALRKALDNAKNTLKTYENAFDGLGLVKNGSLDNSVDPKTRAMLAKSLKNNPRLRQIAELAGRFKVVARDKQRGEIGAGSEEVAELERGNVIARLVPSEYIGLVEPAAEPLFNKKFAEQSLVQYRVRATTPKARGPIIFCIDISASMCPSGNFDPDLWAKATFAGIAEIAIRQKRACHAILFNHNVEHEVEFDPKVNNAMKFAEVFGVSPRGGTTFSAPLFRSLDILEDAQKAAHKPLKRADLIFLTDGEADVPSDAIVRLQALKAKIGLHVTAILVGSDTNPNYVASFADKIESIKDLTSGSAAVVFKEVVKT
jgi:uncharacterized protein with von Willebrand factor type A (vWA) domain